MTWIIAVLGILVLAPVIAYAWWIFRAIRMKRWRKVGLQIGIPLLALMLGYGALCWADYRADLRYWHDIFGDDARVNAPIYAYYGERAFNGDGASVEAFALPQSVSQRLADLTSPAFKGYPKRPSYRKHWRQIDWHKGPVEKDHQKYIEIARWAIREAKEHDPKFAKVEQVLASPDCIYAIFHNSDDDWIGDVDLFIIDPAEGRFYLVNLNT